MTEARTSHRNTHDSPEADEKDSLGCWHAGSALWRDERNVGSGGFVGVLRVELRMRREWDG